MLMCSIFSYALAISGVVNLQPVKSKRQFYKIATLAIVFCIAVVLGNVSLKYIPVSCVMELVGLPACPDTCSHPLTRALNRHSHL